MSELMDSEDKRDAFLKATDEYVLGARQIGSDKLAEIPAIEGELKYFQELLEELERKEKDTNRECLVCGAEDLALVSMTPCGHWYCSPCLTSWLEGHKTCPTCRQGVGPDDVMHVNLELQGFDPGSGLVKRFGTKPAALCEFIKGVVAKEKGDQSDREPARFIVFSQWHSMLQLVARTLADNGIKNVSCSGDQRQRDAALTSFRSGAVRVLMLSMEYAASGTNLQCANHVILLEPAGRNPGHGIDTEAQAVGRAARLGQKRLVTVTRFIIEGTVEEDIHRKNDEARARVQAVNARQVADVQDLKVLGDKDQGGNGGNAGGVDKSGPGGGSGDTSPAGGVGLSDPAGGVGDSLPAGGVETSDRERGLAKDGQEGGQSACRSDDGGMERAVDEGLPIEGAKIGAVQAGREKSLEVGGGGTTVVEAVLGIGAALKVGSQEGAHLDESLPDALSSPALIESNPAIALLAPEVMAEDPTVQINPLTPSDGSGAIVDPGAGPSQVSGETGHQEGGPIQGVIHPPEAHPVEPSATVEQNPLVFPEAPLSQGADRILGLVRSLLDAGTGDGIPQGGAGETGGRVSERGGGGTSVAEVVTPSVGNGPELDVVPMEVETAGADCCPLGCGTMFAPGTENTAINEHIDMCLNQETLTQMTAAGTYQ